MRVLQLGKYYFPYTGGIESHLNALCAGLSREHMVDVLVCNTGRSTVHERVEGIQVSRAGALAHLASTHISPALIQELARREYDLIHLHTPNPMGMLAYVLARKPRHHALVVTHHSDVIRQARLKLAFTPVFRTVMGRADAVIATSERYLRSSSELAKYSEKCHVVPYGIDAGTMQFPAPEVVSNLRRRFGTRVVLAVGRLIYYKGFDVLLRAMAAVDARLVLVGAGPLRESLVALARSLGISSRVSFVGEVQNREMAPYYAAADVFVLPSVARSEAFGIVQLEAMAAGLPVVNTDLESGVPEVSLHGQTGLTVPPENPEALAKAMTTLLDSLNLRARLGGAGRERVAEVFTVRGMVGRLETIYDLARHAGPVRKKAA